MVAALGALPILLLAGSVLLGLVADRIQQRFDRFLMAYQQQLIAAAEIAEDGSFHLTARPAAGSLRRDDRCAMAQCRATARTARPSGCR